MKRYLTSLAIEEMQITVRYHLTLTRIAIIKQKVTNDDEDMEKLIHCCGQVNCYSCLGKCYSSKS